MLATPEYLKQQAELHATGQYGKASLAYGETVSQLVEATQSETLLDYGCGSLRSLASVLNCNVQYQGYDPAVPAFAGDPDPADLVVCIDVLEHIEPDCLYEVLDHLRSKCLHMAFITIHTGPAFKVLSDGRNAHLIQQDEAWWLPKLLRGFRLVKYQLRGTGFEVLLKRI